MITMRDRVRRPIQANLKRFIFVVVVFCLWNRFFLCALPGSPRPPLYDVKVLFCRTAGEGVRRMQSS